MGRGKPDIRQNGVSVRAVAEEPRPLGLYVACPPGETMIWAPPVTEMVPVAVQVRIGIFEPEGSKMTIKHTPPMTAELASKAITLVTELGLKQHQAAAVLGVNQGRISEQRFVGVTPCSTDQLSLDF